MKEKLRRTEKDLDELRKDCARDTERFVTHNHLNAIIEPMRRTLELVQKDVKEILHVVAASHREKD